MVRKHINITINPYNIRLYGIEIEKVKRLAAKYRSSVVTGISKDKTCPYAGISDSEDYETYKKFFGKHKVSTELLDKLFIDCKAKTEIKGGYIEIHCYEDTWRISLKSVDGEVRLEHNNYIKNFYGERYFVKGYHDQYIKDRTVAGALAYIMDYNYDKYHDSSKIFVRNIGKIFREEFEKAFAERSD